MKASTRKELERLIALSTQWTEEAQTKQDTYAQYSRFLEGFYNGRVGAYSLVAEWVQRILDEDGE
jgi:hypothetical protein